MRLRTKILLSHAVMALAVTLICIVIVEALRLAERNQRHLQASYEQIRSINLVAAASNDFSEQIAELFILGEVGAGEIDVARDTLFATLDHKRALIEDELTFIRSPRGRVREEAELVRLERMRAIIQQLDAVQAVMREQLVAGRRAEAEALYLDQVEHRLDSGLGELIEIAMQNERGEVDRAIALSAQLSERSTALAISVVFIVLLLGLGNAAVLNRTISRPVAALAAGADAVGRGDLSHVVGHAARDELGNLATRFDQMTQQLREQRDKLMQAKATLTEQVDERTRELRARGAELEGANARLRELDSSRAHFFADISHELRTPLTVLRGQAEVALRSPDPDAVSLRRTLVLVVRKAEQIGRLVDDLLFLARSEAGTIAVELGDVVLQEVIADVLLDSASLSRREGITISPRQPPEPILVRGDADRLRQAVLIALDNAIKFAPAGSTVAVDVRREAGRALVTVRDHGPGFTSDDLAAAFTRFYRGRTSRGRSGRGVGLGLSIARWIMDRHDGTIAIASAPGEGAAIEIGLPLLERAA